MNLRQKASRLRDSLKAQAENRTNYKGGLLIEVLKQGTRYPNYWLEIEDINFDSEDSLSFTYKAKESRDASIEDVAQGKLINQADGFKIQGLIITQPLGILTPEEAATMLLDQLSQISGLSVEEATLKLTGNK